MAVPRTFQTCSCGVAGISELYLRCSMEDAAVGEVAAASAGGWLPEDRRRLPMHSFLDNGIPFLLGGCHVRVPRTRATRCGHPLELKRQRKKRIICQLESGTLSGFMP